MKKDKIKEILKREFFKLLNSLKKPKIILLILLSIYIESPFFIVMHRGLFTTNIFSLYFHPLDTFYYLFTSFDIILNLIKFNIFIFAIFSAYCYTLHKMGKYYDRNKILELNKLKFIVEHFDKTEEEGELTFSDKGDYGTARWATIKYIENINRIAMAQPSGRTYIKLSKDGDEGLIYGYFEKTNTVMSLPHKTELNRNFAVFGSSGSMKSRSFVIPNILNLIKNNESIIATDPKGELLSKTYDVLKASGYEVKAFNINNVTCSDRWNVLEEITDEQSASVFAKSIIANTRERGVKGDEFWENHYVNLLKALALYVKYEYPKEEQTLGKVYELITHPKGLSGFDTYLDALDDKHPAKMSWTAFSSARENEKVSSGVLSGLAIKLDTFQIPIFRDLFNGNDIDLGAPGKKKCAYFVVVPDTHSTFNFLAGLFFTFMFIKLVDFADKVGDNLPVQVNFLLDEFPNIATIPYFEQKISTVRSRGLSICVILQTISQLIERYGQNGFNTIIGNCDNKIFLGANESQTAEYISSNLGYATIESTSTTSEAGFWGKEVTHNKSLVKRALREPDEVLKKPKNQSYVMLQGLQPIRARKMDYTEHDLGKYVQNHSIYDMLKPWSKKYHEKYLEEIKKQLEIALSTDDLNSNLDSEEFTEESKNIQRMKEELEKKIYNIPEISNKNQEKMEKALDVVTKKLEDLKKENETKDTEIQNLLEKIKYISETSEDLDELVNIEDKMTPYIESLNDNQSELYESIKRRCTDKIKTIRKSHIDSLIEKEKNYSKENDESDIEDISPNQNIDKKEENNVDTKCIEEDSSLNEEGLNKKDMNDNVTTNETNDTIYDEEKEHLDLNKDTISEPLQINEYTENDIKIESELFDNISDDIFNNQSALNKKEITGSNNDSSSKNTNEEVNSNQNKIKLTVKENDKIEVNSNKDLKKEKKINEIKNDNSEKDKPYLKFKLKESSDPNKNIKESNINNSNSKEPKKYKSKNKVNVNEKSKNKINENSKKENHRVIRRGSKKL